MHEGSIPLIVKTGHCEGLYRIKLLSCSYAMRSLTLEIRSTSLHRIERPPKKAMTHICKRDAPPSGFVLDGGRDKISHVHSGDESFLSGTPLADRRISSNVSKFVGYRITSKADISTISSVLDPSRPACNGKDYLSRLSSASVMMGLVDESLSFKDKGTVLSSRVDLTCKMSPCN